MTISDQWVPKLLSRVAIEDTQEEIDGGEREDTPDTDLDYNEQR